MKSKGIKGTLATSLHAQIKKYKKSWKSKRKLQKAKNVSMACAKLDHLTKLDDFQGYGYLWKNLSLLGIDILCNAQSKTIAHRCMAAFFVLIIISAFFYSVPLLILCTLNDTMNWKTLIPCLSTSLLSNVLWYVMYKRRFAFGNLVKIMNRLPRRRLRYKSRFINIVSATFWILQILYPIASISLSHAIKEDFNAAWTFGFQFEFDALGFFLRFAGTSVYMIQNVTVPCFTCLVLSAVYFHGSDLLRIYERNLHLADDPETYILLSKKYSVLIRICISMNKVTSAPAFAILSMFFLQMFNCIASFLSMSSDQLHPVYLLESWYIFAVESVALLWMVTIAASIPLTMKRISLVFEQIYAELLKIKCPNEHCVRLTQMMTERETIEMSACEMIHFTRNFILSLMGGFFTYSLLFINING